MAGGLGWVVSRAMSLFVLACPARADCLVGRWLLPGSDGGTTRNAGESALEILDRRLASGEIDLEARQSARVALVAARRDKP